MEEYPCPCGGKVKFLRKEVTVDGINCGILDSEICEKCGAEYLPDWSMKIVETKLKDAGLWGMERRAVNFWKSGSSVVLRIPKKIADLLNIHSHSKAYLYPEGKDKLIIEV